MSNNDDRHQKDDATDRAAQSTNSNRGTRHSDRPWQDKELLERLYLGEELTTREIADRLSGSNGTISQWLNRHGIPTRENWVAGIEAAKRANRVERVAKRTLPSGYEYWMSKEWDGDERRNRIVYVHRLLAVAEYGFDAVADAEIHHENQIPWDNRPDNIDLMDSAEHGALHANQYWAGQGGTA